MLPSFHLTPNCQWCHHWRTCILTLIKQFGEGLIKFEKVASIMKQGGNRSSKSRSKSKRIGQQRWRASRSSSYGRAVRRNMIHQPPPEFSFAIKDSFFNSATARSFLSCSDNRLLKIQFLIQLPSVSINAAAVTLPAGCPLSWSRKGGWEAGSMCLIRWLTIAGHAEGHAFL